MGNALIDVPVPQEIYNRLQKAAMRLEKSVPALLSDTLIALLPDEGGVPNEIQREIEQLVQLSDSELKQIAQEEMDESEQIAMEQLLFTQSSQKLTSLEQHRLDKLRIEYGRIMLRKARAFALLAERGHSFSFAH